MPLNICDAFYYNFFPLKKSESNETMENIINNYMSVEQHDYWHKINKKSFYIES